jgi:hypothetical protein
MIQLSSPGTFTYKGGASTLALEKGQNASLTLTVGPSDAFGAFVRNGPATLVIAPSGGINALGVTERVKLNSPSDTAFPMVNGIVESSMVGQDTDANRSGDFLTYTAATGLKRATYSSSTNINTTGSTAVFNATTPQVLSGNAAVYALKNNGQTINLAGRTLTVGGAERPGAGLILNGGSINEGSLAFTGSTKPLIYTSLAGGTISSSIQMPSAYNNVLVKFGPGVLTLSGSTNYNTNILVEAGGLKLDGLTQFTGPVYGNVTLAHGATLSGTGTVAGIVAGGLISPGNGAGILTASRTGPADTTGSGLDESFTPTSYAFEFTKNGEPFFRYPTASGNDVLHLLDSKAGPFAGSLTTDDEIHIYLSIAGGVHSGDVFRGGFFTNRNTSFLNLIDDATFRYFLRDDAGSTLFNGLAYRERTDLPFEIDSVSQTANFDSGNVNGYIMEVRVVPEPSAILLLFTASVTMLCEARKRRKTRVASCERREAGCGIIR